MPKSFLVKRIQKVHTAFFPWNHATLVPGYCLSYEIDRDTRKEGYEEEVKELDQSISDSTLRRQEKEIRNPKCTDNQTTSTPEAAIIHQQRKYSEIKVLKPRIEEPLVRPIPSIPPSYQIYGGIGVTHNIGSNGKEIPSPIGPKNEFDRFPESNMLPPPPQYNIGPYYHHHPDMKPMMAMPHHHPFDSLANFRKHQCEYCFKWFKRSSSLSNHRLIHKNDKTFKCNQCNMSFLRKSDLGKHMVIHSGSKPYQCNVCGKRFSQSSNMLTHQRRHTGIRPYSCTICGKSFYRKVDVRRHASVHRDY